MSGSCPVSARVCQETARERDELRVEVERLRAGIEGCIERPTWFRGMYGSPFEMVRTDDLQALLNPTEGDRDD